MWNINKSTNDQQAINEQTICTAAVIDIQSNITHQQH